MNQFINLDIIIWGIYAGISIAAFVSFAVQNVVSRTVMRLAENALSKENAKTAAELGLTKLERRVLCGQLYGKLIFCQNEYYVRTDGDKKQNPYKNPPLDMDRAKFYIPEELRFRAEVRYGGRRPSLLGTAGGVVALGVAFALFRLAAPYLISIFTEAFS